MAFHRARAEAANRKSIHSQDIQLSRPRSDRFAGGEIMIRISANLEGRDGRRGAGARPRVLVVAGGFFIVGDNKKIIFYNQYDYKLRFSAP